MKEHEENLKKRSEQLQNEREMNSAAVEAKLAARRQRKAELARALVEREAVLGWEDEERKILNEKMAQDLANKQDSEANAQVC